MAEPSWRRYAANAELNFNPQANPAINPKAEFELRSQMSAAARTRMQGRLDVRYGPAPRELLDIFPAANKDAPIHVHIHGGYFRMGDKATQSLLAEPFVAAGISCVMPTYDLCPQVSLDALVAEVMDAIEWVWRNGGGFGDARRMYLSGSSVGAHLCAMALAHDWTARGLPDDCIIGAALLTGVYDLEPLLHISLNEQVRLAPERVNANSPMAHPPRRPVPLILQTGGAEPEGWQAQTHEFAEVCRGAGCEVEVMVTPGETHFSILRSMAQPDFPVTRKMISQILEH